jgi:hypothetical protein
MFFDALKTPKNPRSSVREIPDVYGGKFQMYMAGKFSFSPGAAKARQ